MPQLIELPTFSDGSGSLTVFEKLLPGDIKRVFYIYGVTADEQRGMHGHHKTWNSLICVVGSCSVYVKNATIETRFELSKPNQCLILAPEDWHIMDRFSPDAVLLVTSNEYYDPEDYVIQKP